MNFLQHRRNIAEIPDIAGDMGIAVDGDGYPQLRTALCDPPTFLHNARTAFHGVAVDLNELVQLLRPKQNRIDLNGQTGTADVTEHQHLRLLQYTEVGFGTGSGAGMLCKAGAVNTADDIMHFFGDPLIEAAAALGVGLSHDIAVNGNVVAEEMSLQIHNIRLTAPEQGDTLPFQRPDVAGGEILVVFVAAEVREQHIGKVVGRGQQLQPGIPGGADIFLYGRIGVPGKQGMGMCVAA